MKRDLRDQHARKGSPRGEGREHLKERHRQLLEFDENINPNIQEVQ